MKRMARTKGARGICAAGLEELEGRVLMARVLGIDISHWQPATGNWAQVRSGNGADAPGYTFAYAKATEGTGYKDANFPGYVSGAHAAGFKIGAYDYARYDQGVDPVAEANYFLSYAAAALKAGDLVP